VDPDDHTVRLEFAVKQGVRPFGPELAGGQRFQLDASFREFFFSKRRNSSFFFKTRRINVKFMNLFMNL
jgi:hypothetical protein